MKEISFEVYESCLQGRMTKRLFNRGFESEKDLFGNIHLDVCGPFKSITRNGENIYTSLVIQITIFGYSCMYLCFLNTMDEAFE